MADIKITVDSSELKRATQHTEELRGATSRFEAKLKPLIDKERQFNKAVRQVNDAMRLGVATQKQAIAEVERLGKAYGRTKEQIDRTTASMTGIRKNTNRMNATIQNAGYQFGDFFVQVQSGQNVLVAFSQQGAQLAGLMPGLAGAVSGVALVIGSMLVRALADGSTFFKSFVDLTEEAKKALEEFRGAASFSASALKDGLGKEVEYFSDVVLKRKLKGAVEESQSVLDKLLKASDPDRMTLFGKKLETSLLVSRRVLGPINQELVEANDFIQNLSSVDPTNAESLKAAIAGVAEILEKYTEDLGLSEASQEALIEYAKELELSLRDVLGNQEDNTEELAQQKDYLEAILKLEQARDRAAGSLQQKFDASTRKLELMRGGMGAGLAGTQVGMEASIAEAVAAERAVMESRQGVDGLFSSEVESHMLQFEQNLRTRLSGYMEEQAAIKELSSVSKAVTVERITDEERLQEKINQTLDSREAQVRLELKLLGLSKEEAELTKFIYELEKSLGVERESLSAEQEEQFARIIALKEEYIQKTLEQKAAEEKLKKEVEAYNKVKQKANDIASVMANETVGALKSIVNGTKTASEAFRDMALNIIQQIMDILIWQPLIQSLTNSISGAIMGGMPVPGQRGGGGGFNITSMIGGLFGGGASLPPVYAKGGAFSAGNVIPFANGGIVGSPTMFGMSGGRTGLMGEAGPEAIMPLKRGSDGKLGVEGGGNVTVNQTFNFAANGDDSVKKIIAEAAPKIAKMTEAQIINSRQRGGQMRRAFG